MDLRRLGEDGRRRKESDEVLHGLSSEVRIAGGLVRVSVRVVLEKRIQRRGH